MNDPDHPPISVYDFKNYVAELRTSDNEGFTNQYEVMISFLSLNILIDGFHSDVITL